VSFGADVVRDVLSSTPAPVIVGDAVTRRWTPGSSPPCGGGRTAGLPRARGGEESPARRGAALAYGHGVVSWSPIDINMAKQMNLLLADLGFPPIASSSTR